MMCTPPNIIRVIKSRKNELGGSYSTCGEGWVYLRERVHVENPVVDGLIILKWILKKWRGEGRGLD